MKIRYGDLKRLIRLTEAEGDEQGKPDVEEGSDSLDAQVDRYLAEYESMSKTAKAEGLDFRRTVKRLLGEQPAEEKEEEPAVGGASQLGLDDIDVEEFANNVARLIENYDNLLEVRSTLVRRAKNFLAKQYSQDVLSSFEELAREQHGLVPGMGKLDVEDEEFPAPPAARSGPDAGGGVGA